MFFSARYRAYCLLFFLSLPVMSVMSAESLQEMDVQNISYRKKMKTVRHNARKRSIEQVKTLRTMNLDELRAKKEEILAQAAQEASAIRLRHALRKRRRGLAVTWSIEANWIEAAARRRALLYLERMNTLPHGVDIDPGLLFELAELNYWEKNYAIASPYFETFLTLYPAHPDAHKARYLQFLCLSRMSLRVGRDQTRTREALDAGEELLELLPHDAINRAVVINTMYELGMKLFQSELNIVEFYHGRKNYTAVVNRMNLMQADSNLSKHLESTVAFLHDMRKVTNNAYV